VKLAVKPGQEVSARLLAPVSPRACYVLAHGAGAGMDHPFMRSVALQLGDLGIATLRFNFPYMEHGSRRPDSPPLCHATVRAAVTAAAGLLPGVPLIAGGRSFGGRMSSQAQSAEALPLVRGLAFLGFPLHPAGTPADARAQHLDRVTLPMLFIQGSRDALAERALLEGVVEGLGSRATLQWVQDADHSFHVPARTGRKDDEVLAQLLRGLSSWVESLT
jgi:uncharacterized protein